MQSKYPMVPMDEALLRLESLCTSSIESISVTEAAYRVLSEDLYSPKDLPEAKCSVMDGYAVHGEDTPGQLHVEGSVRAGDRSFSLSRGHCSYITTGGLLPESADSVVPIEQVKIIDDNTIEFPKAQEGEWVRQKGQDVKMSQLLLSKGSLLNPAELALLVSLGFQTIPVYKPPVIGIVSTGNELKDIGEPVEPHQFVDSNRMMLKLLIKNCEVKDYGILTDDYAVSVETFERMTSECDIVISSGGVSMGDKDLIKPMLEEKGEVVFGRLNMKPGKPCTLAKMNKAIVIALPGNPVSCFVCYHLFVKHAIDKMMGLPGYPTITVDVGSSKIMLDKGRPEYHRVTVAWDKSTEVFRAISTGSQMSSRLMSAAKANALLVLPQATEDVKFYTGKIPALLIGAFENMQEDARPAEITPHRCGGHHHQEKKDAIVGILTVSDRCYNGTAEDTSGKFLAKAALEQFNGEVLTRIVPDEVELIKNSLTEWCHNCDLVITTGGTGLSSRDVTPEATRLVIEKETSGITQLMMNESLKHTKLAAISRPLAGIAAKTLIVNMPGSQKAVQECYQAIKDVLPHALSILKT